MTNNTIAYKGQQLTAKQAFVVGNFTRRIQRSTTQQKDLKDRLTAAREALVMGNDLRHERGLTDDQDTEWEYPCGKIRLEQLSDAIESLQAEITNFDTAISQDTFQLQSYLDSVPPVAVPAPEAPNGEDLDGDDGTPYTTCCPGGEGDTGDSSGSDDEDDE